MTETMTNGRKKKKRHDSYSHRASSCPSWARRVRPLAAGAGRSPTLNQDFPDPEGPIQRAESQQLASSTRARITRCWSSGRRMPVLAPSNSHACQLLL